MKVDKKLQKWLESDIAAQNGLLNNSLTIFDRIGSSIDVVLRIISDNNDKLDRRISSDETEEILKKFK